VENKDLNYRETWKVIKDASRKDLSPRVLNVIFKHTCCIVAFISVLQGEFCLLFLKQLLGAYSYFL
jgi:hypothetical protein